MEISAAIVATLPPVFAIAVELFNPINERVIQPKVETDLKKYQPKLLKDQEHLVTDVTRIACGAVEVSGLAPTVLAALTSGIAVIIERPAFWLISGYVLTLVVLVLLVFSFLGGQTYLDVETKRKEWLIFRRPRWTGSQKIKRLIIFVDLLLILLVWFVFLTPEVVWGYLLAVWHYIQPLLRSLHIVK